MDKPYYFLHVEDDPLDAEYVEAQLAEAGVPCEIKRVESREDFRNALETRQPDLILCDYNLPRFDGLEALKIAQETPQQAPFIFLSGGIGEHLAVECLHRGATDYVLKGNPARLIPAVRRALEESRIKRAKEQAERELAHGEKMVLLGQLSAGIAHEINNPVTYINLNMETLRDYAEKLNGLFEEVTGMVFGEVSGDPQTTTLKWNTFRSWLQAHERGILILLQDLGRLAQETLDGGLRVAEITQRLRRFSRQERAEAVEVNLEECLETALKIGWNEIKNRARIHRHYPQVMPRVKGHPNQLTQVFLNLVVNAAQAMQGRGDIDLEITQENRDAVIRITDTGRGIAPEALSRLFTPFFTTKPAGEGTGLGLYVSRGIVEGHGGTMRAENSPKGGAVFIVELPLLTVSALHGFEDS